MDDMIHRNNSIAEENINPNGRPAKNKFEEWAEDVSERTNLGYKEQKVISKEEREKRLKEMEEIIKKELE